MRRRPSLILLRGTSLAALLVAMPQVARAQAFQGSGIVDFGSAVIDSSTPGVDTITVGSDRATITWTPSDTATGGGPVNFLGSSGTVNYVADGSLGTNYVVLNRILPTDQSRAVRLDGTINSDAAGSIWFYSPGGLLVGSTARINVGSLLLTASDPVVDGMGDFMSTPGQFSLAGQSGSTSAVVIEAGAELRAETIGQNNYVVAVAPRIQQDGLISVRGAATLVAAESADFAIDSQGLFNISVTAGSSVSTDTFTHSGSTGGPDAAGAGETRRVYMVAIPKNNAITMAIQSSGSIGFDVAGAASLDGNTIVLSAGHNIADSGSGNPIAVGLAGAGMADISIARGSYTSNTYVKAVGNATITDVATGGTPDIAFASSLSVHANSTAKLRAEQGTISVGGDLMLEADAGGTSAGAVALETGIGGTAVTVSGNLIVSASDIIGGSSAALGGLASVQSDGGTITVGGTAIVAARAVGYDTSFGSGGMAFGGQASVTIGGGGSLLVSGGALTVDASAKGGIGGDSFGDAGGDAFGGIAQVVSTGGSITTSGPLAITGNAIAGDAGSTNGMGGSAEAGAASFTIQGAVTTGGIMLDARGQGGSASIGGNALAGPVSLSLAPGSTLAATGPSMFDASARAGDGTVGLGGSAVAGNITTGVGNSATTLDLRSSAAFNASAIGGNSGGGPGGDATAGIVSLAADAGTLRLASMGGTLIFDSSVQAGNGSVSGQAVNGATLVSAAPTATVAFGGGATPAAGDIRVNASLTIGGNTQLTLSAARSIDFAAPVGGNGANALLTVRSDADGNGIGTVTALSGAFNFTGAGNQIDIYYNPASFGTPTDFSGSVGSGNWTGYQLVNSLADLQAINNFLGQSFALGRDIDASATIGWNAGAGFVPLGTGSSYTGSFDGLGHVITNLTVNRPGIASAGLFALVSGPGGAPAITIRNVGLINANIIGGDSTGGLIAQTANCGFCGAVRVSNSFVTGTVTGQNNVGGLIGGTGMNTFVDGSHASVTVNGSGNRVGGLIGGAYHAIVTRSFATGRVLAANNSSEVGGLIGWHDYGSLDRSYASVDVVAGTGAQFVGGLTGTNWVVVSRSYALGNVTVGAGSNGIGGFVGQNLGPNYAVISTSYSTGAVIAPGSSNVGGFVGSNSGVINSAYWDSYTSGHASGFGADSGTITGLMALTSDPAQPSANNKAFGPETYLAFNSSDWIWVNNATRPMGRWEIPVAQSGVMSIGSIHQMQLISRGLEGNYRLAHDIDASETAHLSGVWGQKGFIPLGGGASPFTGTLDGAGHVIFALTMNQPTSVNLGLFDRMNGSIRDLGLVNVAISGGLSYVGGLAANNAGSITGSFVTGFINGGGSSTGGLVGANQNLGSIDNSWSGVTVTGSNYAGGIAGLNAGTIGYTFANGTVIAPNAGGLVGSNATLATVGNSYWDSQASGVSQACATDSGTNCGAAVGLTTAQSRQASSFANWSIDLNGGVRTTWRVYDGLSAPLLKAFLRPLAVGPVDTTLVYDGTVPVLDVIPFGTDLTHLFGTAGISGISRNAGTHAVTYSGGLSSDQLGYDIIAAPSATLTITPAALVLNAVTDARDYDATLASGGAVGIVGLQSGDTVTGLTQSFDSANAGARTLLVDAGYTINDGNGGGNYSVSLGSASGTIAPVALTVTANNDIRGYNAAAYAGGNGVTYAGFVGGETAAVLGGALGYGGTAQGAVNAGNYAIAPGGLTSGNYTISYVNGALSISPAALVLSASADGRGYDATTASAGAVTVTGLQGNDTITGLAQRFDSANAGTRTLAVSAGYTINDGNGGQNYVVTTNGAAGSITPAALTITYAANQASGLYGNAPTGLTGTASATGLQGADTLAMVTSGTAAYSTVASATSGVGSYAVTGGGLTGNTGNYTISFAQAAANGTAYSITVRPITITANGATRQEAEANPPLTYTVGGNGLVNGDSLTGTLATSATTGSPAGSYAITQGTLAASPNYAVTYAGANLTVVACGALCDAPGAVEIANQVTSSVQQQAQNESTLTEAEQKEQAAAESTGNPRVVVNSVIDTRNVSQPLPVDEPVSGTGNSTLWIPGDQ